MRVPPRYSSRYHPLHREIRGCVTDAARSADRKSETIRRNMEYTILYRNVRSTFNRRER